MSATRGPKRGLAAAILAPESWTALLRLLGVPDTVGGLIDGLAEAKRDLDAIAERVARISCPGYVLGSADSGLDEDYRRMEAISELKRILGRRRPDTVFFGFTVGEQLEVLVDGDPDDMLQILIQGFRDMVGVMREDRCEETEIREAAERVIEDMRKAIAPPEAAAGPAL